MTGDPVYARVRAWLPPTDTHCGNWAGYLWSVVQDAGHLDCGGWDWDGPKGHLTCRCGGVLLPSTATSQDCPHYYDAETQRLLCSHQDPALPGTDIVSDIAPFLAADAGHDECAQGAYFDAATCLLRCGCGLALYRLRQVAA